MDNNTFTDHLFNQRSQATQDGVFRHIDAMQRAPNPASQITELAMTFFLVLKQKNIDISQVLASTAAACNHMSQNDTELFRATLMYIDQEL